MTISDSVRMALAKAGKSQVDLAKEWGYANRQGINKKFSLGRWSAEELVKIADFTGGKLMLVYPDGQQILFFADKEEKAEGGAENSEE